MSVRVSFDISDAEYRVLLRLCVDRGVTLPRLGQRLMSDLAEAIIAGRVAAPPPSSSPKPSKPPKPRRAPDPRTITLTPGQREQFTRMHRAGARAADVAAAFSISMSTVHRLIRALGLTPHSRGGRRKEHAA